MAKGYGNRNLEVDIVCCERKKDGSHRHSSLSSQQVSLSRVEIRQKDPIWPIPKMASN